MNSQNQPAFVFGIDIGGSSIRGSIVSSQGEILHRTAVETPSNRNVMSIVNETSQMITQLSRVAKARDIHIQRVGIGIPGFLQHNRVVRFSPNLPEWMNVDIENMFRSTLSLPFVLENDGNCHTLGEAWVGNAREKKHVLAIIMGTGVGGGIMVDGKLLRGSTGVAGEIGHMVVIPDGPPCECGNVGCFEMFASGKAIENRTGKKAEMWVIEAAAGNAQAQAVWAEFGKYLGIGLSSLSYLLEPQLILLGGKLTRAIDFFLPYAKLEFSKRLKNHPSSSVPIIQARFPDDAGLLGAAWLAFNKSSEMET